MLGKRASGKVVLVADLDDVSVGISLAELGTGPASILASDRALLPLEDRTLAQSAAGVVKLLEEMADKFLKANPMRVAAVYVILRAPWTRFRTAAASETFDDNRTITKDIIPAIAKKALEQPSDLDRTHILEAGVMHVALNGYATGSPIGKKARSITVVAFEGDVNPDIQRDVTTIFGRLLPGRTPVFRSGMRALLTVLHEHIPDIHRYVILDVGGATLNCAVVRKEAVTQFATAATGWTGIVRSVGSGVPEETMTNMRLLANDTCSTDACIAMKEKLARAEPELAKKYGEMFASLAARRRLPNRAILFSPPDLAPWLGAFFARIDFAQFTATTQPLEVESLTADHLKESVSWKTGVPLDTGIATAAGCVNILEQST